MKRSELKKIIKEEIENNIKPDKGLELLNTSLHKAVTLVNKLSPLIKQSHDEAYSEFSSASNELIRCIRKFVEIDQKYFSH